MTPEELKEIRQELGLTHAGLARALGWDGKHNTIRTQMIRYENGKRRIPPGVAEQIRELRYSHRA